MVASRKIVVIAGAGPVGLVAAIELARRGLAPIVLDVKSDIIWTSRAVCVSRRSQEIFRRIGMADAFFDKALPWNRGKTFHGDALVYELEIPFDTTDRFAPFVNIQQYHTERYLLDTLEDLGPESADIRWGHSVEAVIHNEDGGTISVRGPDGDYELDFDWLIAADGARSPVRSALGQPLCGTSYEGRYLIADIEVEGAHWPVERHVWFDPVSNPCSTVIVHVQPDGIWRIDIQVDPERDDESVLADAFLLPLIARHLSEVMKLAAPFKVVWRSLYRAHALSMDDYRDRNVLFAGDAAHLVPIFGVRGLNSGIDDAYNLAWKLAMVIEGTADRQLLDSYSQERRIATLENLGNAVKSTWFMSPPGPGYTILRDAVLHLARTEAWARDLINPRQSAAHVYRRSSVIEYDGGGGWSEPGAVVSSVRLGDGCYLHDLLARERLTLLLVGDGAAGEPDVLEVAQALGIHIVDLTDRLPQALADNPEYSLILVRPDQHVAARFSSFDRDLLGDAVRRALGWSPGPPAPFVPIDALSSVVPHSAAEALFSRLAEHRDLIDGDVENAMRLLVAGMKGRFK